MEYKLNDGCHVVSANQAAFICNADGTYELHLPAVSEGEEAAQATKVILAIATMFDDLDFVEDVLATLREDDSQLH